MFQYIRQGIIFGESVRQISQQASVSVKAMNCKTYIPPNPGLHTMNRSRRNGPNKTQREMKSMMEIHENTGNPIKIPRNPGKPVRIHRNPGRKPSWKSVTEIAIFTV